MSKPDPRLPDRRLNAYRPDLADIGLKGLVEAQSFVEGDMTSVVEPHVALRAEPEFTSGFTSEALLGDRVRVFDVSNGWAWGKMEKDHYVGYLPLASLSGIHLPPTHRVCVPATFIYPKADLKSQPATRIFLNSQLTIDEAGSDWAVLAGGGFVYHSHICTVDEFATDPVAVAEQFINVPYLWGGGTQDGLDCSSLIQQAYHACGLDCPRDTDMIEDKIGKPAAGNMQRGDLAFWDGHIGIFIDELRMIHANGHHMAVVIEDFAEAEARISKIYNSSARIKTTN